MSTREPSRPRAKAAQALLQTISEGLPDGRVGWIEPGSYFAAVVTKEGRTAWCAEGFLDLVGGAEFWVECRALADQARTLGVRTGAIMTRTRGAIAVQARAGPRQTQWPLPGAARAALRDGADSILLIAFAPSRSAAWALASAHTLGLTPREVDLASAMLETPSLELAATTLGISRETAKDSLARACRRVGASNASELVSQLIELSCRGALVVEESLLLSLGLTPTEARVAVGVVRGESVGGTAAALGVAESTVKSHRKAIFAKTGTYGERDLRRLALEVCGVASLEQVDEVLLDDRAPGERLRIVSRGDRRVALIDYGPASGRTLLVTHGHGDWRRLPAPFLARLRRDGWRPIVIQRPGFGLTDPADADYLCEAADDMAEVLEALQAEPAVVFARGPAVPVALTFASRHPNMFRRGVIANPHPTREHAPKGGGLLFGMTRLLLRHPRLTSAIIDRAVRRMTTRGLRRLLERLYAEVEDDLPPDRPDILEHLIRDAQALHARTTRGLIDELGLYASGWSTPSKLDVGPWRIAVSAQSWSRGEAETFVSLPGYERREIQGVVVLRAYTDADALADLLCA